MKKTVLFLSSRLSVFSLLISLSLTLALAPQQAQALEGDLIIETGAFWQSRNDVKITPQNGTRLNFDSYDSGPFFHYRLEGTLKITERQSLRLLIAPLLLTLKGQRAQNFVYDGQTFLGGQDFNLRFRFNSYRLTYMYEILKQQNNSLSVGVSLKIRDAIIEISQGGIKRGYDNLGFVPLLYVKYIRRFNDNWFFRTDFDFAVAPQGRALDLTLKVKRRVSENSLVGLGLRTLEGGADNDKVYTFSWINYLVVDYQFEF